ncbi:phage protein NinX family protein [Stutzerimonas stutzeri]|uniref:DUF2591 domain-containing protein n=1 Tax=Stutzerimonas stutzeri TaxID=316 RepID=A0AA42TEQ1_STUST|nr:phage protein NinX family protein [Stutzerimonas stutzeri]MDH1236487.1 DUF2591 domain-containing protein [Stutzerimonas stutzeri]
MTLVEVKTTELIGPALDWAVAKAEGYDEGWLLRQMNNPNPATRAIPAYSTDWSQGGPLIEQYRMHICPIVYDGIGMTQCWIDSCDNRFIDSTPLIAAMRCLVVAKLGDTVQIPSELIQ